MAPAIRVFPRRRRVCRLPIPGTDLIAHVTRWEPLTDKAQNLAWLPGAGGRPHPALTPVDTLADGKQLQPDEIRLRLSDTGAAIVEGRW